jgi:transcription initiation factor IIE alpha subunit
MRLTLSVSTSSTPTLHILHSEEQRNSSYRQAASITATSERTVRVIKALTFRGKFQDDELLRQTHYRCSLLAKRDRSLYWHGIFQHLTRQATCI